MALPFKKLTVWQRGVFAAALLERMLPNYQMFAQANDFGDSQLLRNQLDLIWQKLAKLPVRVKAEAQLEKLEEVVPEVSQFDTFIVYSALDTCMALMSTWQTLHDKTSESVEQVSRLSQSSVSGYVELLLIEELEAGEELTLPAIKAHPLMAWELACQSELFDFLKTAPENTKSIEHAKAMMLSEGVSSLGIEIE